MYHDQGLPVLKALSFGEIVNVTLGLPIVRTSVDHGTALALAGTGRARPDSLFAAVELALELALRPRVRAKKRLGQHFLHDPAVIRRLVDVDRAAAGRHDGRDRRRPRRADDSALREARALARRRDRPRARGRAAEPRRASASGSSCTKPTRSTFDFGALATRAALAARRRQPALQHLDAAAVSPAHVRAASSRTCTSCCSARSSSA